MRIENIKNAFVQVFRNPSYIFLFLILSLLVFFLYVLSFNWNLIFTVLGERNFSLAIKTTYYLLLGFLQNSTPLSLILTVLVSLLLGINFSLAIYKIKRSLKMNYKGEGGIAIGTLLALIAPACPSCTFGIIGIIGLSSFISFIPFGGNLIKVLSILILIFSLFYISNKIAEGNVCKIRKK